MAVSSSHISVRIARERGQGQGLRQLSSSAASLRLTPVSPPNVLLLPLAGVRTTGLILRMMALPPKKQRFSLTNVSWLLGTKEGCNEKNVFVYVFVCKELSGDDVGVARAAVFQEIRQEMVSKPAISSKKSWGGYRRTTHSYYIPGYVSQARRSKGATPIFSCDMSVVETKPCENRPRRTFPCGLGHAAFPQRMGSLVKTLPSSHKGEDYLVTRRSVMRARLRLNEASAFIRVHTWRF